MFTSHSSDTTCITTTAVTLSSLKNELSKSWFYCDVEFIVDDTDYPERAYEVMQRISASLRAIAIMYPDDLDAQKLWFSVRPFLNHMIDQDWTIRIGDADGALCVLIIDVASAGNVGEAQFDMPREGTRQLRNVDAWCNALSFIQ